MLPIQKFLLDGNDPSQLGIKTYTHPHLPLVGYKYDQVDSSKFRFDPVVKNARGIVLEKDTHQVVAKAFDRFFNLGEEEINFNWNDFSCYSKEDGSLILVYNYGGEWHLNTSGSFGFGKIQDHDFTWKDLFNSAIHLPYNRLNVNYTYIFELCSLYNKIVRDYNNPTAFLLSINEKGKELDNHSFHQERIRLNVDNHPFEYSSTLNTQDKILDYLSEKEKTDPTFEGFVLKDNLENRIKVKNKGYLLLHRLKSNGVFSRKKVIELCLMSEIDEILSRFPEMVSTFLPIQSKINELVESIECVWEEYKDIPSQKEFALAVKDYNFSWFLYNLRKNPYLNIRKVMLEKPDRVNTIMDA